MNISQFSETENKLLKRKEFAFTVDYSGATPKREQVTDMLTKKTGMDAGMITIKNISGSYGKQQVTVVAYGYLDSAMKEKIEVVRKKKAAKAAETK